MVQLVFMLKRRILKLMQNFNGKFKKETDTKGTSPFYVVVLQLIDCS